MTLGFGPGSSRARKGIPTLIFAFALPVACGKTESPKRDTPADFLAWDREYARAWCEQSVRCNGELGPYWSSADACTESRSYGGDYDRFWAGSDRYAGIAALYRLAAPEARAACIAAIARSSCKDTEIPAECEDIEVLAHTLAEGEPCGGIFIPGGHFGPSNVDACGTGLSCGPGSCPVCVKKTPEPPLAKVNESCSDEHPCEGTLTCDFTSGPTRICHEPAKLPGKGEACSYECADRWVCRDGRCAGRQGRGEQCDPSAYDACEADLYCVPSGGGRGECRPVARLGEPCYRFSADEYGRAAEACLHGLWCVFDAPDALMGVCSGAPEPAPGSACSNFGFNGDEMACPVGATAVTSDGPASVANGTPSAYCRCDVHGPGAACTYGYECDGDSQCVAGHCGKPLSIGASCSANADCDSGYCDLSAGKCASNACPSGCPGVDRNTDLMNCGACGNVCAGIVAIGSYPYSSVSSADEGGLYTVTDVAVLHTPLAGGEPETLATGQFRPGPLVLGEDAIYFLNSPTTTSSGDLIAVSKGGTGISLIAPGEDSPFGLVGDEKKLFWVASYDQGRIRGVDLVGGAAGTPTDIASFTVPVTSLALDADRLYAVVGSVPNGSFRITSLSRVDGTEARLVEGFATAPRIVIAGGVVYFATDTTLDSVPAAGGTAAVVQGALRNASVLGVAGGSVFYTTSDGTFAVPVAGGEPKQVFDAATYPLQVNEAGLFFNGNAGIFLAPLTGARCVQGRCE